LNGAGCNVLWNSTVKPWWEGDEDGVADAVRLLEAAAATIRAEVHPDQNALPPYLRLAPYAPSPTAMRSVAMHRLHALCARRSLRRIGRAWHAGGGAAGQHSLCGEQGRRRLRRKLEAAHFVPQWTVLPPSPPAAHTSKHAHERSRTLPQRRAQRRTHVRAITQQHARMRTRARRLDGMGRARVHGRAIGHARSSCASMALIWTYCVAPDRSA
jgi:hypothetical protein